MNPVVEKVYQEIKKLPGLENAVIAGGACRDELMGGNFTDIDIFFPVKTRHNYQKVLDNFIGLPLFQISGEIVNHRGIDYINDKGFVAKCDLKYMNIFDIDLVGYNVPVEDYPVNIVNTFNYNIDKVYYNGELVALPECQTDIKFNQATLSKLQDAKYMVVAVEKFQKLRKKYPDIKFNSSIKLEKGDSDKKERTTTEIKNKYWFDETTAIEPRVWRAHDVFDHNRQWLRLGLNNG